FDAVAALLGVRDTVSYEGQAAVELEWLAWAAPETEEEGYVCGLAAGAEGALVVDTRPLVRAVVADLERGMDRRVIARRFHVGLADVIALVCDRLREETGLDVVALSGGVFMNVLLTGLATRRLTEAGFRVLRHERVPPNDGGLALGQAAVA